MLLKPYKDIDPELRDLTEKIGLMTGSEDRSLQIDTIELMSSSDKLVQDLNYYLLASAKLKDNEYSKSDKNKIAKAKVNWIDIVFEGGSSFDPELDNEVERILEGRESSYFITDEIKILLSEMKDNNNLIQAINKKMEDCTKNPRSYWDFIRGTIKWNNTKQCLICPDEDCLIYIYDYYYSFLKEKDDVSVLKKIYILMLCEARICALSKCIILEAIRQSGENRNKVEDIIRKIYERDKTNNFVSSVYPKKYSTLTSYKKPSMVQKGGDNPSVAEVPEQPDPPSKSPEDRPISGLGMEDPPGGVMGGMPDPSGGPGEMSGPGVGSPGLESAPSRRP